MSLRSYSRCVGLPRCRHIPKRSFTQRTGNSSNHKCSKTQTTLPCMTPNLTSPIYQMCKCTIHNPQPSCSWVISRGHLTLASKTDRSEAEKRFTSSSKPYLSPSFFFANSLPELVNLEHTCSTIQAIQQKKKASQKLQVAKR